MPLIQISALKNAGGIGGPSIPSTHTARLIDRNWPGGGTVKVLSMQIGDCTLEVSPAVPEKIREFGEELIKLASKLLQKE